MAKYVGIINFDIEADTDEKCVQLCEAIAASLRHDFNNNSAVVYATEDKSDKNIYSKFKSY